MKSTQRIEHAFFMCWMRRDLLSKNEKDQKPKWQPADLDSIEPAQIERAFASLGADDLDALIDSYSEGWRTDRMPAVDRALLRMAVFELLHRPDVPTEAVLTEVVELAGDYSTERSGRFVNGVASRIAEEHRPAPDEE